MVCSIFSWIFTSDAPTRGENDGLWLTRPQFVGKRIDVKVVGVADSKFQTLVNSRSRKHEGDVGFIVPLGSAPSSRDIQRKGIKLRVKPFNSVAICPADAVKPQRQTPSNNSIGEEKSRVIIIGPDIHGSWVRVGDYAETIPAATETDRDVVWVRFTRERQLVGEGVSAEGNPVASYHLASLCRALNEDLEVEEWKIARTDFDAPKRAT